MADIKSHSTLPTNLLSYWDLEESSGKRYDLVSSLDLDDGNTVTGTTGKIGEASLFTSANSEYLTNSTSFSFTGDYSYSFWIKLTQLPSTAGAAFEIQDSVGATTAGVNLRIESTDKIFLAYKNGGNTKIRSDNAVFVAGDVGVWRHVAVTVDVSAQTAVIKKDNSSYTSTAVATGATSVGSGHATLYIGRNASGNYGDYALDDFGVWDKILTSSEITDLYNSGSGLPYWDPDDIENDSTLSTSLVSHYKMDSAAGSDKLDSNTTNGNDLSDPSSVASTTGIIDNAANFDGSTDYLNITDANQTGLDLSGDCSFSFWINRTSSTGDRWILCKSRFDGSLQSYDIWHNAGTIYGRFSDDGSNTATNVVNFNTSSSVLTASTTHHVLITFDISTETATVYVDGVNQAVSKSGSMGASLYNNSMDFVVGRRNRTTPASYLHGWVDEVIVYSKEATVAEARALYGYGTPPPYGTAAAAANNAIFFGGGF
tara:strand:- start:20151 stop:21605 length:1455 start_codon:yes stop_codon:yes gene_type:complete